MAAAALIGCGANTTPEPTTTRTSALTRTLASDTDTFINSWVPGNNNGASPSIYTGRNGQGGVMRGLIRFALPPELQARVTVTGVRLALITRGTGSTETNPPTPANASLQALTTGWGEGSGFGDAISMFTLGQPCVPPGATWDQPNCAGGTAWPGGAVAGAVSGTASVPAALEATVTWDSASAGGGMVTDVQSWIDDPTTNHGWRIVSSTEGGATAAAQKFYSSEEVGGKGPSLVIDYNCKPAFAAAGNLCTSCTAAAVAACAGGATGPGNVCVDPGVPATTHACVCGIPGYVSTGAACVDRNECSPNPCDDGGDSAATCVDHAAPATGYDCTCGAGFVPSGGATPTCVPVAPPETSDAAITDGGDAAAGGSGGAAGAGGSGGGAGGSGGANGGGGAGGSGGSGAAGTMGGRGGATGGGAGTMGGGGGRGGSNAIGAAGATGSSGGSGCSCNVAAQGGEAGGLAGLLVLAGMMLRVRRRAGGVRH